MAAEPGWTLRQRLQLIITVALLPIVLVSMLQGVERARLDIAEVHDRLIQSARAAAASDQNVLASAEQILRAMGSLRDVADVGDNCDEVLSEALIGVGYFSNMSRIDASGRVVCSAQPLAKNLNVAQLPVFQDTRKSRALAVSGQIKSRVTNSPVIAAMLGQYRPDKSYNGALSISLGTEWLNRMLRQSDLPRGAVVVVFDRAGQVAASNNPKVAGFIAASALKDGVLDGLSSDVMDDAANHWHYGVAGLTGNNVFVAFAMRESRLFGPTYIHVGIDLLLPIVMIALAWVAIWLATDRQVTQWILYLRRVAVAYRSGHYAIRPDLAEAPVEFKLLGDAMSDMAAGIQDRDRRLRESVTMKTTLIKEIHHRVKNNLQIVMSLLSIQANQVKDAGAREALVQAQTRINALALVHRILNELEDQSTLDLNQLLEELCRQICECMGAADHVRVDVQVPHRVVSGGVAVALALFTVEALTNIFKHAFPAQKKGVITVVMDQAGAGKLRLSIADDGMGFSMDTTGKSVGSRLIKTFGLQLGGVSSVRSEEGRGTVVELVFPDPELKTE
jgi:two-component sensor histidine kinase